MFALGTVAKEARMLMLPKCRHCKRAWLPQDSAVAERDFCNRCKGDRREIARKAFALKPNVIGDADGAYVLPRKLRGRWPKRA
jgi:hypothetical protein